ncbi:MAG: carbon starvation protein A [Planctomycetota bacterium]
MILTLVLLFGGIAFLFVVGYAIYGRFIEKRIVKPDADKLTPAFEKQDGLDYIPARTPLLWGHHFSNIAGAGPIIGPLMAVAAFGWAPTLLWIILGCVFFGAVHDYLVLSISMRNGGVSIASVAEKTLGKRAKIVLSVFLLFSLILIVAVFAISSAATIVEESEIVIPTFGIIPLAFILGLCVYKLRMKLFPFTVVAIAAMAVFLYLGYKYPVTVHHDVVTTNEGKELHGSIVEETNNSVEIEVDKQTILLNRDDIKSSTKEVLGIHPSIFWTIIFFLYGLLASLLPVGYLDQPRDYISTAILFFGMGLGLLSLIIAHPAIEAPAFISYNSAKDGPLWPMLFVIVACGAISGFHALVSGGTTAKQLRNEKYQRVIGYGAMLAEGVVALMAALLVAAGLSWKTGPDMLLNLLKEKTWIGAFGTAYGNVTSQAFGFSHKVGALFAMLMLNAFVLTTLDTAVRLGRYIVQESLGEKWRIFKNRVLTSFIVIIPACILAFSNSWKAIWPIFGAANQLIAALALIIITAYLLYLKLPTKYTLIPAVFILITTIGALIYQMFGFLSGEKKNYLLGITAIILIILAVLVVIEALLCLKRISKERKNNSTYST